MDYKKHRLNIYPEMQPDEFERLRTDIFTNGYDPKNPVWIFEGEIIDGWNRYRACQALGITPVFRTFEGSTLDALQFLVRTNNRRDLNSSQRAAIAVEAEDLIAVLKAEANNRQLANLKQGNKAPVQELIPERTNYEQNETRTQLAQTFNTNPRYVSDAARIKKENPKAFEAIKSGQKVITEVKREEKQKEFERRKTEFIAPPKDEKASLVIKCYNGDCVRLMQNTSLEKCSLLLSDPPYGMDFKSGHVDKSKWDKINNDKIEDTISILDAAFSEAKKHLLPDAHVYIFGNPNEIENIKPLFCKYFNLKNILIWDREVIGMGDLKTYGRSYDVVYFGYNEVWRDLNGTRDRDILRFTRVAPNNLQHPTEKPLDILEYIIRKSTSEGDYILDPFAGSCTTLLAAKNQFRNAYGFELEAKYIPAWMTK